MSLLADAHKRAENGIVEEEREVSKSGASDEVFGGYEVDRNNAAAARLRGFETDLKLEGQEFNALLSILYFGYILMQIHSNMFLNYTGRPSIFACMHVYLGNDINSLWRGEWVLAQQTCGSNGLSTFYSLIDALLTRLFLGFVEAVFFPGALFIFLKSYTRNELGFRFCLLYCGIITSNALGSLIASGILNGMQGKFGRAAWRWLFYIEGSLTIVVALAAVFILPDFPTTTQWLTPDERRLAIRRMAEDGGIHLGDQDDTAPMNSNLSTEASAHSSGVRRLPPGTVTQHKPKRFHLGNQGEGF